MERIGRYEIVRELGRGSMAIVYEGFDGRIDRNLAIKVLRSQHAADVNSRQRFLREARAAGGLSHPNIVTIFDVGLAESKPYLVMELLSGGTLEQWITSERHDQLDIARILEIALQLARALDYAHTQGVIHRDIKPANIHYDPNTGQVKMMDFGIAAIQKPGVASLEESRISGTPTHLAPELLKGALPDERSDIYSLGIVLYELLSGQLPFTAQDLPALLQQVARHETRPLKPTRADTPRELIDLTLRMMAADPEQRPASARQVAEELEEIIEGRRKGLLHSIRHKSASWRAPALIIALISGVLLFGLLQIYRSQVQTMAEVTYGFGEALVSLVAQETAEPLILDDATALSLLVSDFSVNPEVRHLHIIDNNGLVVASTNPFLRGQPAPEVTGESIELERDGVRLASTDDHLLIFSAPIRFQARRVGEVQLAIDGAGLERAARNTLLMLMMVFAAATVAMVVGVWWLMRRLQVGVQRVAWALKRLERGQYEFRLEDEGPQELHPVMREFNRLAVRLQQRQQFARRAPAAPGNAEPGDWLADTPDAAPGATLDLSKKNQAADGRNASRDDNPDDPVPDPSKVTPLRGGRK